MDAAQVSPARRWRSLSDRVCASSGLLGLAERRLRGRLTVLTYHRVLPDELAPRARFADLVMPLGAFERQLACYVRHYEVLPVGTALERLQRGEHGARPLLALSFDDGFADNARCAAPALERAGLRATFFPSIDFVRSGLPLWTERAHRAASAARPEQLAAWAAELARQSLAPTPAPGASARAEDWVEWLKRAGPTARSAWLERAEREAGAAPKPERVEDGAAMRPDELRALHERGHELGSHGCAHELMPQLAEDARARELGDSRAQLEQWIGAPVRGFCYPNGDHDAPTRAAARAAGYAWACGTQDGANARTTDAYALLRRDLSPARALDARGRHDELGLRCELSGLRQNLRGWRGSSSA